MPFSLKSLLRRDRHSAPHPLISPLAETVHPTPPTPPLAAYSRSSWVYLAVNRIAEAAALVPLRVYRLDGERKLEEIRHPFERLMDAPNPFTSRFELIEQTLGFLELAGSAFWYLTGSGTDTTPAEIWCLRPDRVAVVPDAARHIKGYVYEVDGVRMPLDAAEVVHFKRWHPTNDYYGLSALAAARLAVEGDRAMAEWNHRTFGQDNAVPAGIVSIHEYVSDADFERIKREWRSSYGGTQRRTAFLRGGAVEWQSIGLSHSELDFLEGRRAHRDEILSLFGLPVALVSENATEANATVAERLFIERTLYPKLVRLAQKITQEIMPFWGGDLIAEFDDIRPTDASARLAELRAAYPVLSVNEIRERYFHLPPVTWGSLPPSLDAALDDDLTGLDDILPGKTDTPEAGDDAPPAPAPTGESALDELARWERYALKRLTRPRSRPFEARVLPPEFAFEVAARLLQAESGEAVRAVFARAREHFTAGAAA
ncbi:MAG TPA: phage portal protein [Aggregatilineales bacterium]|nr:phage portal protein [Aggregatilineales bacterium]